MTAPPTGQCPVSLADVRHTKLSVLFTVLRDSHGTLTLGLGRGGGGVREGDGGMEGMTKARCRVNW